MGFDGGSIILIGLFIINVALFFLDIKGFGDDRGHATQ